MRTVTIGLGHACCAGVLCAHGERGLDLGAALRGGGGRLILRGLAPSNAAAVIRRARAAGFQEVVWATAACDQLEDAGGADAVRAILFSHVPAVHDRLTGRPGSLARSLMRLRRLSAPIEVEAPILPSRLSDPRRLAQLITRAFDARAVRFYVPGRRVPRAVAPPRFDEIAPLLAEAVEQLPARFDPSSGVVLCAFAGRLHGRFDFPKRRPDLGGRVRQPECERCAVRRFCGGPTEAYAEIHGGSGLKAFAHRPRGLTGEPERERPTWGPTERAAARRARFIVLRPTIHCNQDCLFCSANESSKNAFEDPRRMFNAIVRAADRGIRRVSFSGGEPTLSPHLRHFVRAASRLGIPEVEVVSNAVLLARPGRVEQLVRAGLTHAFVSLHAHDEPLSVAMTQKRGDHGRTLEGISRLLDGGVQVAVNHVITTRNRVYLSAFVQMLAERFQGRVFLSFAFVTPQYKALQHPELVPRFSETVPELRRAMRLALSLGQPFVVGARQGVPPCLLGPFVAWSDVFETAAEAASEDAPQKIQGPACARCRHRQICPGLWGAPAAPPNFSSLTPPEGEPFSEAELAQIAAHHRPAPWGVPLSFSQAPAILRDEAAEVEGEGPRGPGPDRPDREVRLPLLGAERTRPLRVLMVGSGARARRLGARVGAAASMTLVGVCSPHAAQASPRWWGTVPTFARAADALEAVDPEAVIIAAATPAHDSLVGLFRGVPALLEKPAAVHDLDAAGWVSMAIQELFEPGLAPLLCSAGPLVVTQRCSPDAPDAPPVWGRASLFELLHHLLSIPVAARGALVEVQRVSFLGAARPTALRASVGFERGVAEVAFDATSKAPVLEISVGARRWLRRGGDVSVDGRPVQVQRGAEESMIAEFRDAVLERRPPPAPLPLGLRIEDAAARVTEALQLAGAPLIRATEPKHSSSGRNQRVRSTDRRAKGHRSET